MGSTAFTRLVLALSAKLGVCFLQGRGCLRLPLLKSELFLGKGLLHALSAVREVNAAERKSEDDLHSRKLTWKPKKGPKKTTVLLKGGYMGFHVSLGECNVQHGLKQSCSQGLSHWGIPRNLYTLLWALQHSA